MKSLHAILADAWQFGKFSLVGVLNTAIDFGVFMVLHGKMGLWYPVSQVISYSCGMTNSYLLNKFWTFKSRRRVHFIEVAKFVLVNLAALGIALGLLVLFRGKYAFGPAESKVLATLGSLSVNFLGNRLWVFRER
jgi:putative flippase GtrA|uniref:GtrA family protein n=1 Tax=Candidatus Caldatribacterium californiense TaxID=1454726 RepID=A0A7V3YIC5_9BACT